MQDARRRLVYRLYPSRRQDETLLHMLGLHHRLYNAALEQRITAWRLQRKRITAFDQSRDLTELRSVDEEYRALDAQSEQVTLARLHRAFDGFFRRCKSGETPGFPRFRSFERFKGWGYKTHGTGFRFFPGDGNRHGRLRLSGVGTIQVRGRARTLGEIKTCEIQRKAGRWYASFSIACDPQRKRGVGAVGIDWGIETFATIAHENMTFSEISNPRFARQTKAKLDEAHRVVARRTKRSKNRTKARKILAAVHRKTTNRRRNFLHQQSAMIVGVSDMIATETLSLRNMTRSARGTVDSPGQNVAQKSGLNREILATAPGAFLAMLQYKAAEAGIEYVEVPARTVKPTQTCSSCGSQRKKRLSERQHICPCGLILSRDQNAARVNLLWALARTGREPIAGCLSGFASGATRNSNRQRNGDG